MNEIDHFMPILMKREEEAEMTPLVSHGPSHFLWIKHSNLYRIHLYIARLYKTPLWMCLVVTSPGGLACSVSCASSRLTPGSHISAAGSSSASVSQPVERMRTTSVWSVRHTCTLLIQHHFHRSSIFISFISPCSFSLLSSNFTHRLVTFCWVSQRLSLGTICGLFQHSRRCYFSTFLLPVVAMTKKNANAALVYSFLYKIVQVGVGF